MLSNVHEIHIFQDPHWLLSSSAPAPGRWSKNWAISSTVNGESFSCWCPQATKMSVTTSRPEPLSLCLFLGGDGTLIYIYMCVIYINYIIFFNIYIIIIYYIYYIYMFILYIYVYIILIHVWCFLRRAAAWPTNTHNSDHIPNFPIHFLTLPFKFHTRAQRY